MVLKNKRYNLGIVLSGGAARGFAHTGVLKSLHEHDFFPDVVAGVSAGSIVGAFYADGYSPDEILGFFTHKRMFEFIRLTKPTNGFFRMTGLKDVLEKNLRAKKFEDLQKPFWVSLTNFGTGKPEYVNSGNLIEAILASSSIPAVFEPVKIGENYYVDGGVADNLPLQPIKDKCKKIIGVYVNPIGTIDKPEGILHTAFRTFHLSISAKTMHKINEFSLYIEPEDLSKFSLIDVEKGQEMFEIGYKATNEILSKKENLRKIR